MCSRLNSGDHQRGKAVCPNGLDAPLELADAAVLTDIERYVLHPRVVRRALTLACQELRPPAGRIERERSSLQRGLHAVDGELSRLTTALASGGDLSSLVEAIRDREQRRETLAAQLAQLAQVRDLQGQNVADLERRLRAKLANWRELLRREAQEARQILQALISERITFTPGEQGGQRVYRYQGTFTIGPLLEGVIDPRALASPRGILPFTMRGAVMPQVA